VKDGQKCKKEEEISEKTETESETESRIYLALQTGHTMLVSSLEECLASMSFWFKGTSNQNDVLTFYWSDFGQSQIRIY
jgi:ABC-type uncharacterized transport system permease subunit